MHQHHITDWIIGSKTHVYVELKNLRFFFRWRLHMSEISPGGILNNKQTEKNSLQFLGWSIVSE